ncbi:hypothetical protein [[Flexibacter] sp. ATCC 35208]|uniref:hypothetical protein n=1 Tax=[Flexibacter] sp. ATCC 35208 TaxID=1936242 RepID=UPI0011810980|nr:hypothetical protein [[Flexibacter] sp. ATCC 35208]
MEVIVSKVFQTSLGLIVVLNFPNSVVPRVNMRLIKGDIIYLINGVQFESPRQNEAMGGRQFSCLLSDNACNLAFGDVLNLADDE